MFEHLSFAIVSGGNGERVILCGLLDVDNDDAKRLIGFHSMEEYMKDECAKKYFEYHKLHTLVEFRGNIRYAVAYIFRPPMFWSKERTEAVICGCFDDVIIDS